MSERRKVTVVGAGNVGATCAQVLAQRDYADIVLVDIKEGKNVTYDMKPTRNDPTAVGTSEVADAIIEKLGVRV